MTSRLLLFLSVSLAGFLASGLSAQTDNASPSPSLRTFRVINGGNWQSHPIKYDLNARPVLIEAERALSQPYACPADKLVLYNEIPPPPDAKPGTLPRKQILATLSLASDQMRFLVVLVPDLAGKISFTAVPDAVDKHPAGTLRILNFSDYPAAVAINTQQYMVPLGSNDVIIPFASGGTLIQSAIQKSGKWIPTYRRERIARPRLHSYGFVFNFISEVDAKDTLPPPTTFTLIGELPASGSSPAQPIQTSRR